MDRNCSLIEKSKRIFLSFSKILYSLKIGIKKGFFFSSSGGNIMHSNQLVLPLNCFLKILYTECNLVQ